MDFRNIVNLRVLILKSSKQTRAHASLFSIQESYTFQTRNSSRLSGILSVSPVSELLKLSTKISSYLPLNFAFTIVKLFLIQGCILPTTVRMGLQKHIKRTQVNLQVFALLKEVLQNRQGL
jgi:hypothetical protein